MKKIMLSMLFGLSLLLVIAIPTFATNDIDFSRDVSTFALDDPISDGNYRFTGQVPNTMLRTSSYYYADVNTQFTDTIGSGDSNFYLITIPSAGKISVALTGISGVDNDLYLLTTSGTILVGSENPAGDNEYVYTIQNAGQYFVLVNNYAGYSASAYSLAILYSTTYDVGELDNYFWQAKTKDEYFLVNQNIDSFIDEDYMTFTLTSASTAVVKFSSNETTYKAEIYKVTANGQLDTIYSEYATSASGDGVTGPLALTAGQYYFRVFPTSSSYGSNYLFAVNAFYNNIYEIYHANSTLQNLVYRNHQDYISLYANGLPLGSLGWGFVNNTISVNGVSHLFSVSAGGGTRYHPNVPLDFVSGVGVYVKGQYYNHNTVRVRVENVNYFYSDHYVDSIGNDHSVQFNFHTSELEAQPPMYYVFDIATGQCIAFMAVFHDDIYPLPNGSASSFTEYE
jgi:hypothetical protein